MKFHLCVLTAIFLAAGQVTPLLRAQEVDGSDINKQLTERDAKIGRLTLDEQLRLRAAQKKAIEDPAVKEALVKRDAAIEGFRKALHDSMVKDDPKLEEILQKISVGSSPGF